ncbi:pentapeptide repeat-containing protein [Streptomyces lomondensis]
MLGSVHKRSTDDRVAIVESISAYLRAHTSQLNVKVATQEGIVHFNERAQYCAQLPRPDIDVQAAVGVLSRRDTNGEGFGKGEQPDLHDVRLTRADLPGAHFRNGNFTDADLRCAIFTSKSSFRSAILVGAHLQGAKLRSADFRGADLRKADLRGADLRKADLTGADLTEADLRGAQLDGAQWKETCTAGVKWSNGANMGIRNCGQ